MGRSNQDPQNSTGGHGTAERHAQEGGLVGQEIIVLSHQRWRTHVTAVHHTVVRLARSNRVLFIEPPDSAGWLLRDAATREALRWMYEPLERKDRNLHIYHTPPLFLPGQCRARWIARSVSATYEYMIRSAKRQVGFRRPIFWIYQFNSIWALRALQACFAVYECGEQWAEFATRPHVKRYVERMDEQLCRHADVVIVPSKNMYDRKRPYNGQTHLVPWGVDISLYGRARSVDTPVPADIAGIAHPIVGMFGYLDGRRLHVELITRMAGRHRDWQIVLVGPRYPNLDAAPLEDCPNVHMLGMKTVEELPGYCKAFDVCMIPYLINEFTRSIMPLKLAEYLATGKPIVTTALPAVENMRDMVYVADTMDEFERLVEQAMSEDPKMVQSRLSWAEEYDWDAIVDRKMAIAADRLRPAGAASSSVGVGA